MDAPAILDLRTPEDAAADPTKLPAARRLTLAQVEAGQGPDRETVVYCQKGGKISQLGAALLRGRGISARFLAGGHLAWLEAGLPVQPLDSPEGATWIMEDDPSWADLARLWTLRRLIDPTACILAVAADQVDAAAAVTGGRRLEDLAAPAFPGYVSWHDIPEASPTLETLLCGRLARVGDPLAALDLIDDALAGAVS
ncbi:MAG: rhodanese-like domain-containing protein [Pseudomonadota bacterium]